MVSIKIASPIKIDFEPNNIAYIFAIRLGKLAQLVERREDQQKGELAQLVERLHGMQEVTGSNPVFSTTSMKVAN